MHAFAQCEFRAGEVSCLPPIYIFGRDGLVLIVGRGVAFTQQV